MVLAVLVVGCPSQPVAPPPEPDVVVVDATPSLPPVFEAGPVGDVYSAACTRLAAIGCAEGGDVALCTRTLRLAASASRADMRPACLADAGSKDAARACGTVECP